jgi:hypothetical protein
MDAERAARQIIDAMRKRRAEIILTPAAQIVARGSAIVPGLTSGILHLVQQLALPSPAGRPDGAVPGGELRPAMNEAMFSRLTALGQAAARRFNQLPSQPANSESGGGA